MDPNKRPDDMVRIATPELAQAFIDEQAVSYTHLDVYKRQPSDHPVETLEHSGQGHVEGRGQRQSRKEQHAGVRDLLNGIRAGEEPRPMAHQVRPYAQQRKSRHRADGKRPIPYFHVSALRHAPPLASIAE